MAKRVPYDFSGQTGKRVPYDFSGQTGKMVPYEFTKQSGKMVPALYSGSIELNSLGITPNIENINEVGKKSNFIMYSFGGDKLPIIKDYAFIFKDIKEDIEKSFSVSLANNYFFNYKDRFNNLDILVFVLKVNSRNTLNCVANYLNDHEVSSYLSYLVNNNSKGLSAINKYLNFAWQRKNVLPYPTLYLSCPDWYHGFVGDTWINYWAEATPRDDGSNREGQIWFKSDNHFICSKINFNPSQRGDTAKNTLWISKLTGPQPEQYIDADMTQWLFLCDHDLWQQSGDDIDVFDNISFNSISQDDGMVRLSKVSVKLNGKIICDTDDNFVRDRHWLAGIPVHLHDDILAKRYSYIFPPQYYPVPPVSNALIWKAAGDIGQAWNEKYGMKWGTYADGYCQGFFSWLLGFGGYNHDKYWFFEKDLWICRWSTEYKDLGFKVKLGFYITLGNIGHAAMFVEWLDRHGKPSDFNPNATTNYFKAVSGMSDLIVKDNIFKIHNSFYLGPDPPHSEIWYQGYDTEKVGDIPDGFGDTTNYPTWRYPLVHLRPSHWK